MGSQEAARINIGLAMDLLEQSLPGLGSESEEGQKVMAALRSALMGFLGAVGTAEPEAHPVDPSDYRVAADWYAWLR